MPLVAMAEVMAVQEDQREGVQVAEATEALLAQKAPDADVEAMAGLLEKRGRLRLRR